MFYQMNHTGNSYKRGPGKKMTEEEWKAYRKREWAIALVFAFIGIPLIGLLIALVSYIGHQ